MNKSTSLYLDFLRIFAAFGVLLNHANFPWFSNSLFPGDLGHKFVAFFFVLSGFLIAFTVDKKNKGGTNYLISRFSRLYSVVFPALIFTYLIDHLGIYLHPAFYSMHVDPDRQAVRFFLNLTFMQQIWNLCIKPSTNGPFWSIAYEFWYYIMFWVFCYYTGGRRIIGLLLLSMFVGIKILLLLPVWIFGVIAYKCTQKVKITSKIARIILIPVSIAIVILTFIWDFSVPANNWFYGKQLLFFSANFVFDWVYGLLVAINVYCFSISSFELKRPMLIERAIKHLSSISFSLYLFHFPLLVFIASIVPYNKSSYFQVVLILILVLLIVNVLSIISEKQREHFKKLFEKTFSLFTSKSV